MGVTGLSSFVKDNSDLSGCTLKTFPPCKPNRTLVVDGSSLIHKLYRQRLDWVRGGSWGEYRQKIIEFCKRWKNSGFHLVFFFDAGIEEAKEEEAVKNVRECFLGVHRMFSAIRRE